MECDGPVDTPDFYTKILQGFAEEVAEEAEQTTPPLDQEEKKELKTGSKEAKDAAKKADEKAK